MGRASRVAAFGRSIGTIRRRLRISQRALAERVGVSGAHLSRIEHGRVEHLDLRLADDLCEQLGAHLIFGVEAPSGVGLRRQADPAHARAVGYVARRLGVAGWRVEREVPIGGFPPVGWIDVIATHPASRVALISEVKCDLDDLGAAERQLRQYERYAHDALREIGWSADHLVSVLLLLATSVNDRRCSDNGAALSAMFPARAADLAPIAAGGIPDARRRAIALIDPRSRARRWLRPLLLDGRRSRAPYRDYADFMRACESARRT